jgi:hypothetical protein
MENFKKDIAELTTKLNDTPTKATGHGSVKRLLNRPEHVPSVQPGTLMFSILGAGTVIAAE